MTFKQMGQLIKRDPRFRKAYGSKLNEYPDEFLAERLLERYPEKWNLISPAQRRLRQLVNSPIVTGKGFWDSWDTYYRNVERNVETRRSVIEMVAQAGLQMDAAEQGMTIETHQRALLMDREHEHLKDLELFRRNNGLDGRNRVLLTTHELAESIRQRLFDLIDKLDRETHPRKRRALEREIAKLEAQLDGPEQQNVVQAGVGA